MNQRVRSGWSIRARLLVLVVAIFVLFVALYAYSTQLAVEDASREVQTESMQLAQLLAANMDQFVAEKRRLLETLVRRPLMRLENPSECDPLFADLLGLFPSLGNFGMTDHAGKVVCSALPQGSRPASVADKPFFKQLMATGLFTISDPFMGPISHKWVLSLVQPRRDDEGHLLGALGMPIDLVRFEQVLGGVNLPEGGVVTMINAEGRVLTRTHDPMTWVAKDVSTHALIKEVLAHDQGNLLALDIDGRERYIGFARVPSSGWRIYVGVPAGLVVARAEMLLRRDLKLGGLILLLVMVMGVYVSHGIAQPIRILAETVRRIAAGDSTQRAVLAGPREITEVALEFNALLDRRRVVEEELRQQHVRAQQYLDIASVMFGVLDTEGRIAMINRKGCAVLGYAEQELLGKDWFEQCLPPDIRAEVHGVFHQLITGQIGAVVYHENKVLTRSGEERFLAFHNTALKTPEGRIEGALFSAEDITERRRAEQALKEAYGELERRVAERTAMLDQANQELESFSYSVSHDLRAPLRGIEGFSQALFEDYNDRLDATGQDYLRRVNRSCQRMNALIDDLLTLSRATSAELHRRNCDLGTLGAEIIAELRSTEPERSLTFAAAPDLQVHGDPELLRIALGNLLSNAWKFTRRNAAASIELGMTQEQGRVVYFVRDNGVGFDMQYAGRLFVPFQRLHHLDEFEGTGIGLATVQRIIRRHGGTVWAQGQAGAGATFYFTLGA